METSWSARARSLANRLRAVPVSYWPAMVARAGLSRLNLRGPQIPENYRVPPHDDETIARDADYAFRAARDYRYWFEQVGGTFDGAWLIEIGPGRNFGAMLALAGLGARVAVADRFLTPWDDRYHAKLYPALRAILAEHGFADALGPLDAVIAAKGYSDETLLRLESGAENVSALPAGRFDGVFSNAVLEHVQDLGLVLGEFKRMTKPGGHGWHQVDFRDHFSMARPLEMLLMSPAEFAAYFDRVFGECGCQRRPKEARRTFEETGFSIVEVEENMHAEEAYLQDFIPRLRASASGYRDWPIEDLRPISVRYVVRNP